MAEEENTSDLCASVQPTAVVSSESGEEFIVDGEKDIVVPSASEAQRTSEFEVCSWQGM